MRIVTGWTTEFERFAAGVERTAEAAVDDQTPVPGGRVIVELTMDRAGKETIYQEAAVSEGGLSTYLRQPGWPTAQAYYVPAPGFAGCGSETVRQR